MGRGELNDASYIPQVKVKGLGKSIYEVNDLP